MLLGAGEIVVVLAVALMVLGPKKMPEVARKLALLVAQFRRMADEVRSQVDDALNEPPPTPKLPTDAQTPPTPPPSANAPSGATVNPGSGGAHDGADPS